jgi:hypothetical protein
MEEIDFDFDNIEFAYGPTITLFEAKGFMVYDKVNDCFQFECTEIYDNVENGVKELVDFLNAIPQMEDNLLAAKEIIKE